MKSVIVLWQLRLVYEICDCVKKNTTGLWNLFLSYERYAWLMKSVLVLWKLNFSYESYPSVGSTNLSKLRDVEWSPAAWQVTPL